MSVDLRPASTLGVERLAGLLTQAYEEYVVPFQVDAATLDFMIRAYDLDLDASRVAFRDGEPIALANVGLRGESAWIGGIGVVPSARRGGLGERLMHALFDEARARGVREMWLEVIVENEGAIRLYEKLRFETLRDLEVWRLDPSDEAGTATEVAPDEARTRLASLRRERDPWQRSDETLAHLDKLMGVVADGAASIFREADGRVSVLQLAGDEAGAATVLSTLRERRAVSALNIPARDPVAAAFERLGGSVVVRQHEMRLAL